MAKKVVIKMSMNDQKSRTKALKIAVGLPGVESAGFQGEEKNKIEVTGEFDSVELTCRLRKKIGYADLVTVEEKKKEKKEEPATSVIEPMAWPFCGAGLPYYHPIPIYEISSQYYRHDDPVCSMM